MEFKRWSELSSEALKEMKPDFGYRSWSEIALHERRMIWKHLEYYFFSMETDRFGNTQYYFLGDRIESNIKSDALKFSLIDLNDSFKAKCYAPNYFNSQTVEFAFEDFYSIFVSDNENAFIELLSLYIQYYLIGLANHLEIEQGESPEEFQLRRDALSWMVAGDFVKKFNETMSQFGFKYLLTKSGFFPKLDKRIDNEIYLPVIESLANPRWKEVNDYLQESFDAFRLNSPQGFSTCITKTVTAVQAFLQILVEGKTGSANISSLIPKARKANLIPKDDFTKELFDKIETILAKERQHSGDAHPRKEFANEKNARLVLNLAMVFFQHCLA